MLDVEDIGVLVGDRVRVDLVLSCSYLLLQAPTGPVHSHMVFVGLCTALLCGLARLGSASATTDPWKAEKTFGHASLAGWCVEHCTRLFLPPWCSQTLQIHCCLKMVEEPGRVRPAWPFDGLRGTHALRSYAPGTSNSQCHLVLG